MQGASARSTAGRDRGHRAGAALSQGGAGLCGRTDRPGIDPEDVDVTFEDGMLRIAGEKKEQREENERGYRVSERTYGAFERLIELPPAARPDRIDAKFKNGVLAITVAKDGEAKRNVRKIKVSQGG
jgi:HSP20 family protein